MKESERKNMVADAVREAIQRALIEDDKLRMDDLESLELIHVSRLETHLRLRTLNAGTHYYLVKVSETL